MILINNGELTLKISLGMPNQWRDETIDQIQGYYHWEKITLQKETRFLRFEVESAGAELTEICLLDYEGNRLPITSINPEGQLGPGYEKLVDEQEKITLPIDFMSETYFDEIYFVRAAEDYLNSRNPYENTHPPLGKEIIALGILILGFSPFSWRISGVIFATLMIPVLYVLGKELTKSWIWGAVAAFLFALDFMHFTMSRIATVDTYVVFFSLASQIFFYKYLMKVLEGKKGQIYWVLLSWAIFFSLAFSTKWYAIFGLLGQFFLLIACHSRWITRIGVALRAERFGLNNAKIFIIFLGVAGAVYFFTFIPQIKMGYGVIEIIKEQFSMFSYHYELVATHPFSSPWYSWPIIFRPVWLWTSEFSDSLVSNIVALGNPAVWWFGVIAIIHCVFRFFKKRDLPTLFIITIFSYQWLSYALISRPLFLYHYYINVPILCIAISLFLKDIWSNKNHRILIFIYLAIVIYLFITFYPIISGIPASRDLIDSLKWFNSWTF